MIFPTLLAFIGPAGVFVGALYIQEGEIARGCLDIALGFVLFAMGIGGIRRGGLT